MSHRIVRWRPDLDGEIAAAYADVFGAEKLEQSRARWQWQYLDNPHTPSDGPVIWVAVEPSGRVLGQMATMPFPMWWGDREVRASAGMDYFVRPDAQGRGLGIALSEAWADNVDVALALGLTPSSYPLFRKIFTDVGPVPAWVRVLDATAVATRRWGAVAGAVAGPMLRTALAMTTQGKSTAAEAIEIREVPDFDDEYDDLWTRARASFATVVRRDARYLTWKYLRCPFRQYRILEARAKGTLAGFCVIREEGDPEFLRGVIVDLFCDTSDEPVPDALIDAALDVFAADGLVRAETYTMNAVMGRVLGRHGFMAGRTAIQYCVAHHHASAAPLARLADWQLVLGDGDLDRG